MLNVYATCKCGIRDLWMNVNPEEINIIINGDMDCVHPDEEVIADRERKWESSIDRETS